MPYASAKCHVNVFAFNHYMPASAIATVACLVLVLLYHLVTPVLAQFLKDLDLESLKLSTGEVI